MSDLNLTGTSRCEAVYTRIGRTRLVVLDCPGFNDTKLSDAQVLAEISRVLSTQYLLENELKLCGILYLRDITKARMEGSDVKTFELFYKLVGRNAFPHVVFVTTKWGLLDDENRMKAEKRELELKDDFWKEMIIEGKGSYVTRFLDTKDSAEGIISQIIGDKHPVVLKIQQELVDEEMQLSETSVGAIVAQGVDERLERSTSKIERCRARLERESNSTKKTSVILEIRKEERVRDQAQADHGQLNQKVGRDMKSKIKKLGTSQETLRTACSVLGIVLSVVVPLTASACSVM